MPDSSSSSPSDVPSVDELRARAQALMSRMGQLSTQSQQRDQSIGQALQGARESTQMTPAQLGDKALGLGGTPPAAPAQAEVPSTESLRSRAKEMGGGILDALWNAFKFGSSEAFQGVGQLASRMPAMSEVIPGMNQLLPNAATNRQKLAADMGQRIQQGAQKFQANPVTQMHPIASAIGRIGGNVAAQAPLMAIPGGASSALGRIGAGSVAGGLGAATLPASGDDYWTQKAKQVGTGAATGGVLGGAGAAVGPALSGAAQSAIVNFPHIASIISGAGRRTPDNFNRAVVNQALDPIKAVAPTNLKAGHGLIEWASDRLTDAYNKVLPKLSMAADPQFTSEIESLRTSAQDLPPGFDSKFIDIIERHIEKPIANHNGILEGQALKQVESQLTKLARNTYAKEPSMVDSLLAARESLMDAAARQNPEAAAELKDANLAYAMFSRVRDAASRKADAQGIFTPQDLLLASKAGDKSSGKINFARGGALMQAMAEATKGPMATPQINRAISAILGTTIGGALGLKHGGVLGGAEIGGALGAAGPEMLKGAYKATQTPAARAAGGALGDMAPAAGQQAPRAREMLIPSERLKNRTESGRKVSEIQRDRYEAVRRGDIAEVQKLNKRLAEANSEYRKYAPFA